MLIAISGRANGRFVHSVAFRSHFSILHGDLAGRGHSPKLVMTGRVAFVVKRTKKAGLANIRAVLRAAETSAPNLPKSVDPVHHKRQLVAQLCRLIGDRTIGGSTDKTPSEKVESNATESLPNLSPR